MNDRTKVPRSLSELVVHASADALAVVDLDRRWVLWNDAMALLTGKSADGVLGRPLEEVSPLLGEPGVEVAIARALGGEAAIEHGLSHVARDGVARSFDRFCKPLRADGGALVGVSVTLRDVTAQRQAEDALRASEEQVQLAVESAGVGLWSWNRVTDEVQWEDTLCAIFGLPPGSSPAGHDGYVALIHPDDRARRTARIAEGVVRGHWEDEYRILRSDTGAVRWVMSKGSVVGDRAVGAVLDITERRQRDEQLLQSQKLEAVGQLTAGIAHNFNNALMGILANLDIAVREAPARLAPLLREAEQSAERAAQIVRELMTYAGRNRPRARRVEAIGPLVERTVAFCRTTFDQRTVLDADCATAARARIDPSQIEQALLNTLINARDAVAELDSEVPRVTVKVDLVAEGAPELEGRAGSYVRIRVGDNGAGIDPAAASRIFEPFFTTKPAGKGTGLGLATTRTIMTEHGGFVACTSKAGEGATFSLYLPSEADAVATPQAASAPAPVHGTERVLVVDDDASIRSVVARIIGGAGFQVTVAASGDEALAALAEPSTATQLALALVDVSMPGISAPELRRRIRVLAPQARVVYLTGYAFKAADPEDSVLEKPVSEALLLGAIRAALDRGAAAEAREAKPPRG